MRSRGIPTLCRRGGGAAAGPPRSKTCAQPTACPHLPEATPQREAIKQRQPDAPEGEANSPWIDGWCFSYRGWRISPVCPRAAVGEGRPPGRSDRKPAFRKKCKKTNSNPPAKARVRSEPKCRASELRRQTHPATHLEVYYSGRREQEQHVAPHQHRDAMQARPVAW